MINVLHAAILIVYFGWKISVPAYAYNFDCMNYTFLFIRKHDFKYDILINLITKIICIMATKIWVRTGSGNDFLTDCAKPD